jgi:hypothetical protein
LPFPESARICGACDYRIACPASITRDKGELARTEARFTALWEPHEANGDTAEEAAAGETA